ncbi:hypothetical protein N24_2141 [Corynebacterium suranareeae]|uniref:Probable membrane transporter protein n=1 Tax=Corynebacterium suranareeae TaxID=2506452 RepID=A0A160PT52_9CORY|nr:hypothetical protein N24_2141 [Corynebacterium suranareeae]
MPVDWSQIVELGAIFTAGFLAGGINVIVGAGTLVSFPILVFLGFPPMTATIANTIGIVPGSISGVLAYRNELYAQRKTIRFLLPASIIGGITGASLLLHFSADVFTAVIPWLIGIGTALVMAGPAIKKRVVKTPADASPSFKGLPFPSRIAFITSILGALLLGTYGGYFSAAQ